MLHCNCVTIFKTETFFSHEIITKFVLASGTRGSIYIGFVIKYLMIMLAYFSYFSIKNISCGYSLEAPQ